MLKPIGTVFIVGRLRRVCRQDRRGKRRQDHRRRLDRCLRQHRHVRFHRSADGSRRTDPGRSTQRIEQAVQQGRVPSGFRELDADFWSPPLGIPSMWGSNIRGTRIAQRSQREEERPITHFAGRRK